MKRLMGSKGVLALLLVIITAGSFIVFPVQHVAFAASLVPGDWPTYLVGPGRSGFNKDETIINPTTVSNLKVHWTRGPRAYFPIVSVQTAHRSYRGYGEVKSS